MGSMNFGLFPMLAPLQGLQARLGARASGEAAATWSSGTPSRISSTSWDLFASNGTRFEFECYDIGHLYNLRAFPRARAGQAAALRADRLRHPRRHRPHPEDVMHMKRTADRLFGDQYRWSVLGAGRNQMQIAAMAAAMGGNVRVGLEDSLWDGPGRLAEQQRRAGAPRPPDHRRSRPRDRDARRGARDPRPQGRRQGRVLNPETEAGRTGNPAAALILSRPGRSRRHTCEELRP